MTNEAQIEELKEKIAVEENPILVKAYQAKLASLEGKGAMIGTGMTADEYEEAAVEPTFVPNFPQVGDWPAVFNFPYDDTIVSTKSGEEVSWDVIRFPFHVPADGHEVPFAARDDSLIFFKGTPKEGYHSPIKGALVALGVAHAANKKGEIIFDPAEVEGKVGKVLYRVRKGQTYVDAVTDEEKPSTIANARAVIALDSDLDEAEGDIPF